MIDGLKDTDGEEVAKYEDTVTVTDTTAPVTESVEVVNHKVVKIYFSEAVSLDTAGIYKTSDVANAGAKLTVDGNLVFAKFTAIPEEHAVEVEFFNALADGNHEIVLSDVKDFAGFKGEAKTFNINTVADVTAPLATSLEYVSPTSVKVHFNEALKGTTNPTGSFVVKEAGNAANKAAGATATLSADKKTVTLTGLTPLTAASIVGYDVTYKNVEDIFGNKITTDTTISSKVEDDAAKPTVTDVKVLDGNVLQVTYSEKVNESLTDFVLYKEDGKTVVASQANSVVDADLANPDGKTFKVTFNALSNIDATNYVLKVQDSTDLSIRANEIADQTIAFTAKDSKAPTVTSAVLKADATGDNDKIELRFSEAIDSSLAANVNNYFVGKTSANVALSTVSGAKVDSVSADGKTVVLLVPKADGANGSLWAAAVDAISAPALKDASGNLISNASIATPYTVSTSYDAFAASDVKAYATGKNTIVVESLDAKNLFAANQPAGSFKFNLQGATDTNIDLGVTAAQVSTDGKTVTLTFANSLSAEALNGSNALELVVAAASGIKDQNGTELAAIANGTATAAVADKIKATQLNTTVGTGATADEITVDFDEQVKVATGLTDAVLASGMELKIGTSTLIPNVDYTSTITAGDVVVTVLKNGVDAADVSVEIKRPEYLSDLANNGVNVKSAVVVEDVTEKVAAQATGDFTNADTKIVTINFNEVMDASTLVDANFSSVAGGAIVDFAKADDNKSVTITFTNGLVTGNTVVVAPAVTDVAGNASGQTVTK